MPDIAGIFRLTRLELRKLRKGTSFYIISTVIILFSLLISTNMDTQYSNEIRRINEQKSNLITQIEAGQLVIHGNAAEGNPDYWDYTEVDETGRLLPENIDYWVELYSNYFADEIEGLTAEGGPFSYSSMVRNSASGIAILIPILAVAAAVSLFASEYRNSTYRLIISRGVIRSHLISAKVLTVLGQTVFFALLLTVAVGLSGYISYNSLGADTPPVIEPGFLASVFAIAAFMFAAYMMGGALLGTILASPTTAMTIGLIIAFIGGYTFLMATPCQDGILGMLSPLSLGYNFNSLIQEYWSLSAATGPLAPGGGGPQDCYRDAVPAILTALGYTAFYTIATYTIFSRKELKA